MSQAWAKPLAVTRPWAWAKIWAKPWHIAGETWAWAKTWDAALAGAGADQVLGHGAKPGRLVVF